MAINDWTDAEQRADRARQLYEQGHWAAAARELRAAIDIRPEQGTWHFNLGLTLEAMDDFTGAVTSFETALVLDDGDLECRNCLAVNLARLGRYDEALSQFKKIDRIDPDYEPSYCNRIALYTELGHHQQAELMFYRARQITDTCPVCSYNIAHSLFLRQDYQRAVLCWEDVLRMQPEHPSARVRMAEAYWRLGKHELAETHYQKHLAGNPTDVDALLDIGDLMAEQGQTDRAAIYYHEAATAAPTESSAYAALGELALTKDRPAEAESYLRMALTFNETSGRIRAKLAEALLSEGKSRQACRHLTLAMKHCAGDPRALSTCAHVLLRAHRAKQAQRVLTRVVRLCPESAVARHNLAVACFRMHNFDEGIRHCRAALRIRRDYALAWYNLAVAHMKRGELWRARGCAGLSLQINPSRPEAVRLVEQLRPQRSLWTRLGRWVRRATTRPKPR